MALDEAEVSFFADIQTLLSRKRRAPPKDISRIGAVDAAYRGDRVAAVATVFEHGRMVERSAYAGRPSLSYISGLFYLLEGPFVTEAVRRLTIRPQLVCFDAHGAAHPRAAGLATICGMVLGIPSVGIAKSLLVGTPEEEGELRRIVHQGRTVGFVVETGDVKRYWSPGYSVNLRELESIVRRYAPTCLQAMFEADRGAKEQLRLS